MRCLFAVSLVVLVVAVSPTQASIFSDFFDQVKAMFQTYEEAPYVVITHGQGYEERRYPAARWVCKRETDNPHVGNDLSLVFWPLFNYIAGQNDRSEKIPMTVPVSTKFEVRDAQDKTYEMCFYLGNSYQQNPPQPNTESGVFIQERPELRVLTRTVGGYFSNEESWLQEAGSLAAVLEEEGITVNLSHMYWVGYDSPMKFWFRRNEIWFPVQN